MTHRGRQFFLVDWLKKERYIRSHQSGERKMAAIHHLKVIRPASEKCAVALPVRKPNATYRSREHLTEREVERLIEAARRDAQIKSATVGIHAGFFRLFDFQHCEPADRPCHCLCPSGQVEASTYNYVHK